MLVRADGRVESGSGDALVLRQQVVGELVEVADAADHGRRRHEVIAAFQQLVQQLFVFRIALDEAVVGMFVVALLYPAVLAEVVQADDVVAGIEQFLDEITVDETG